jgi:putative copper export protein
VITVSWETVRISLHVLAATIWVGGQITLGVLVPALRAISPDAPRVAARGFNPVAWTGYAVLVATGAWNVAAEHDDLEGAKLAVLWVKIAVVAASGLAAFLHIRATSVAGRAVWGAVTALTAVVALVLGVLLHG